MGINFIQPAEKKRGPTKRGRVPEITAHPNGQLRFNLLFAATFITGTPQSFAAAHDEQNPDTLYLVFQTDGIDANLLLPLRTTRIKSGGREKLAYTCPQAYRFLPKELFREDQTAKFRNIGLETVTINGQDHTAVTVNLADVEYAPLRRRKTESEAE